MENEITRFLAERMDAGDFPSAVYLVAQKGRIEAHAALGYAVRQPKRIAAEKDTIYDLASLTKPLVTALLAAIYIERGMISLDQRVATLLGEFEVASKRMITIRDLVTHTSRLPAWRPLYLMVETPDEVLRYIASEKPDLGGQSVIYSDLNFIVLGIILERLSGQKLDELAQKEIFDPLALQKTFFCPPAELRPTIAASELGNLYERNTCIESGYAAAGDQRLDRLRKYQIWGEVHDGNAWFMKGVAGHAGAFSTASETLELAKQFLPESSRLLKSDTCALFTTNFTEGMNEHRSFGFQLASTKDSTAGLQMSPASFGHLGFTGTSCWIDPVLERVFVLLTNRTHDHALPFVLLNSVRRQFHDIAIAALDRK